MSKERKSPRQKKVLEYTRDHFAGGFDSSSHGFAKGWRRKKARVNRERRRKSDELLAPVKPGLKADDVEIISEELTTARFQNSVTRERLNKIGVITMGERVKERLERRADRVGIDTQQRQHYDRVTSDAVRTLNQLSGGQLIAVVNRAELVRKGNRIELDRIRKSGDPVDQALNFLYAVSMGSGRELDALRRNPEMNRDLGLWIQKANRIMERDQRKQQRKLNEKEAARQKMKIVVRRSKS
jgi:hypothetical protein